MTLTLLDWSAEVQSWCQHIHSTMIRCFLNCCHICCGVILRGNAQHIFSYSSKYHPQENILNWMFINSKPLLKYFELLIFLRIAKKNFAVSTSGPLHFYLVLTSLPPLPCQTGYCPGRMHWESRPVVPHMQNLHLQQQSLLKESSGIHTEQALKQIRGFLNTSK